MAGHNKWVQIKRKKGVTDAQKSKTFSKLARLITLESKKAVGNMTAPGLRTVIEKAKSFNMPSDNIERAVKKGAGGEEGTLEAITYEAYGQGGVPLIIEALTTNRNKASSEIKHILSEHGAALGAIGSASWAFTKTAEGWVPNTPMKADEVTQSSIDALLEELLNNDEVQDIYTNLIEE